MSTCRWTPIRTNGGPDPSWAQLVEPFPVTAEMRNDPYDPTYDPDCPDCGLPTSQHEGGDEGHIPTDMRWCCRQGRLILEVARNIYFCDHCGCIYDRGAIDRGAQL